MQDQSNNYHSDDQTDDQLDCHFDIVILGAGIAGLWLLNRLQQAGYNCCLLENHSIGGKQSIASQGMIHGGIKYALSGALNNSSETIASMPDHWKACLEGKGDVDLRGLPVLSNDFYLWSSGGLGSKLTSFFASKLTRGRVEKMASKDNPPALNHKAFKGKAYKLVDVVMDVPALTQHLAAPYTDRIFKIDANKLAYDKNTNCLSVAGDAENSKNISLTAQQWLCAAGEGNGDLIKLFDSTDIEMQLRPLQQVFVTSKELPAFYGHCIGASASPSPRLTVSSHPIGNSPDNSANTSTDQSTGESTPENSPGDKANNTQWVWYLGGDLATEGVNRSAEEQITFAKKELETLFPWYNWQQAQFSTLTINRAEPKQKSLIKPDDAFIANSTNNPKVSIAWPTKLTLAPALANQTLELLNTLQISKTPAAEQGELPPLPTPQARQTEWLKVFGKQESK